MLGGLDRLYEGMKFEIKPVEKLKVLGVLSGNERMNVVPRTLPVWSGCVYLLCPFLGLYFMLKKI